MGPPDIRDFTKTQPPPADDETAADLERWASDLEDMASGAENTARALRARALELRKPGGP